MASTEAIYCLDTSALLFMADIYSADTFPDVWEQLTELVDSEDVIAPREVRRELEKKEDNGALSWVKKNTTLLRALNADQSKVASEIVNSPQFQGLIDLDAELPDADPFVVALAVTCQDGSGLFKETSAVVGVDAPGIRVGLANVCEDPGYPIRFLSPYQMLREIDLDVPEPGGRGLADLYGIWEGLDITEEDIEGGQDQIRRCRDLIYLLDANAIIRYLAGSPQLSPQVKAIMDDPGDGNRMAVPTIALVEAWGRGSQEKTGLRSL